MKDKKSVHGHLNVFNSLGNELLGTGLKIGEGKKATIFLCLTSDSWDNLVMSMSHCTKYNMNLVIASLSSKEMRKRTLESLPSTPSLPASVLEEGSGRSQSNGPFKWNKSRGKSKTKRDLK